ncbi:hypothetical protein BGW36DRAFT_425940 [Talaromyces proteolyticus]|uniref:Uncharacterized protein n=1 Tax=Talaromyces proteolyticus TaxID=1131652 RepID=A0AAD4KW83_9EURO|nr:uncharacterized protein BGW36DRAFT_425940 [Talaromyces proteolyticus]KAH8701146.1 hypothetical protein BGW36DRAFT_425940 [Talaromyces proteolyticus]
MVNNDQVAAADERLLERLNALKPSTVRLQRDKKPADFDTRSHISIGRPGYGPIFGYIDDPSSKALEEEALAPESLFDGDAIEELLASIEQRDDLTLRSQNNTNQVQSLLTGASDFVKDSKTIGFTADKPILESRAGTHDSGDSLACNENSSSDEEEDDIEAARYVKEALDEVNVPSHDDFQGLDGLEPLTQGSGSPSNQDTNDDALSYQLTALFLPSVPKDLPVSNKKPPDASLPPQCCCICYDTATTTCLDCEGELLYCVSCWKEMHEDDEDAQPHRHIKFKPS